MNPDKCMKEVFDKYMKILFIEGLFDKNDSYLYGEGLKDMFIEALIHEKFEGYFILSNESKKLGEWNIEREK